MITGDYNLAAVQVTVGNFRVTGWAPDDALQLAPMSDSMESEASADGSHVSISRINDPRWEATLIVRRNTAAFRLLFEALQDQETAALSGAVPDLAFRVFDPISGDRVTARQARFMRSPDLPFSNTASNAEFKLLLPNPKIVAGENIPTSA